MIVFVALVLAAVKDMKTGRISNNFNLCLGLTGLVCGLVFGGLKGLLISLLGAIIPVVLLFILFLKGVLGAGDIKLFSALGTFAGVEIIWLLMYSFVLCGVYGLTLLVTRLFGEIKKGVQKENIIWTLTRGRQYTKVAFSVFILGGYIWYLMKGGFLLGI